MTVATGRTAPGTCRAKTPPTIKDNIADELRARDARLAEDRLQAEAAHIREQRRIDALRVEARVELAERAEAACEALQRAAAVFDGAASFCRTAYLDMLAAHGAVAGLARLSTEASGIAGECIVSAKAIAGRLCQTPADAYHDAAPVKSCAVAAEQLQTVLLRSFNA